MVKKHLKNAIRTFRAEGFRGFFRVPARIFQVVSVFGFFAVLWIKLKSRLKLKREKYSSPIVGNEVVGHADVLWKKGRWQRIVPAYFPSLWRMWKRAETGWQERYPHGLPKYVFRIGLLSVVLILTGAVSRFYLHAEIAKFYPSVCLGGWQNTKNVEGQPELSEGAPADDFTEKNSAVLGNIVSQIYCSNFIGEIPKDASMTTLLLKLSWSPEGVHRDAVATTTVEVNSNEDISSSTQQIIDAPSGAPSEVHLENTPPLDVPANPTETPTVEIPGPPTESAPISLFDRLFQQAFAEEAETVSDATVTSTPKTDDTVHESRITNHEATTTDAATTDVSAVIPSEVGIQKTVTTLDPVRQPADEDDGRDGTTTETTVGTTTAKQVNEGISASTTSIEYHGAIAGTTTATTTDVATEKTKAEVLSSPATPEFLEVLYTLDGTTWLSLGKVSRADWKSEFKIPVTEWDDISKLQISVQSLPSIDTVPKVYLDGMWLEAEYDPSSNRAEKVPEKGNGTISSAASVEGAASTLGIETIDGTEAYVLSLNNPGEAPDYKYEFLGGGVALSVKNEKGKKELMSGIEPIPEYNAGGNWQAYHLSPTQGTYSGWREDISNGMRRMIREFQTTENGTPETFTEIWTIPDSAEELGSAGPKATYAMTKNASSSFPWRLRLAYRGIKNVQKEIKKDENDIRDEKNYPIRKRDYGDFSIDISDFDRAEAKNDKPKHAFSEKGNSAEAIFFPEGTTGERLVDPTTVTTGVATGWGHNKSRAVFYTGGRYWLLYTDATGKIYYKSSTDNSTWTATTTLITNMSTTNIDFDTFLVNNATFDLAYPNGSEDPIVVTATTSGSTLATSSASAIGAATTCNSISVARTPSNNRIFLACRITTSNLAVYSANQTGDANSVTSWTTEIGGATETEMVNQITMAPYAVEDTVLVMYERDSATNSNDCIWSRAIKRSGGAGTAKSVNCTSGTQFASDTFGNLARTASNTFSFPYSDMSGTVALREAVWNGTSATWSTTTSIVSGAGIKSPSLFYDNVTGDLYAFASTTSGVVYYKKTASAGTWGGAITADNGETGNRQNSFPVTQMQMMFPAEQTFLPWAYRTTSGSNFDLKVGTLGLHGTTTQRAYFFLNDDGGDVDAYTKSHGATATSSSITGVKIGERLIARIQVDNITAGTTTKMYRLQWRPSAGSWADLSTTTAIRWSLSQKGALHGRSGEVPLPTNQLGACISGTTYQAGRFVSGNATSSIIALGPNKCTELAFAIETSGAAINTTYELRLVNGASGLPFDQAPLNGSYAVTPTFTTETAQTFTYSKEARGGFATSTLDATGTIGQYTSLAIGTDGFPVMAYYDNTGDDLEFRHCGDTSCATSTTRTLDTSIDTADAYISLAIGSDGFPVISYYDDTQDLGFYKCNDTACTSGTASKIDTLGTVGESTAIAIGADGFPVMSYFASSTVQSDGDLWFAKCNNISCTSFSTTTVDVGTMVGPDRVTIAIGSDGFPVMSYRDADPAARNLMFAKCNNALCTSAATTTIDSTGDDMGRESAIAIGADGFPVFAHHNNSSPGQLRFDKCSNISCTTAITKTILDLSVSDSGHFPSIAIGTDGFPIISYFDNTPADLEFAKCNNASCSSSATSTLDSAGFVGEYSSIAIGTDGYPVISFYRGTGSELGFLKCSSADCSDGTTAKSNLPSDATDYDTFLDDVGYTNVATSDNLYDSLVGASSTRLAFNFKKANSSNSGQITVTWEGQVSIATTTSLQIYNNSTLVWDTIQTNATPTGGTDFTLTGSVNNTAYFDGSFIAAVRAVTGTTTQATTLKTDQINIQFATPTLTQRDYIFLNDDGADVNNYTQAHSAATSSSISNVKKGERLVARIQIDNTGTATNTAQYRLQWASSTDDATYSSWYDTGTTTEIQTSLSIKGALWGRPDGVPLKSRQVTAACNGSAPTFQEGRFIAGTATSTAFGIGPARCTEIAYAFETSGATLGKYYRLRVVSASTTTAFASYATYPTLRIETARTLTYSKEARGGSASSTIPLNGVTSQWTSLAIGTDGFPVIGYEGASNFLEVAHCTDAACNGRTINVQNGVTSTYVSLAIGTDGFPVISYKNGTSGFLEVAHCTDVACAGRTVTTQNAVGSSETSIAIGTDGFPVIGYSGASSFLEVDHCLNAACTATTTAVQNAVASTYISLAIGTDGFPVIGYSGASNFLNVAHCLNVACTGTPTITAQNSTASQQISLAIGADGFPIISYENGGASGFLEVDHCTNIDCTAKNIAVQNSVITNYTSTSIGTDGFPVISYRNNTSTKLEIAHCINAACTGTPAPIVQNTVSSSYTSLAIGTDGFPVISYEGASNFLNVAKCNSIGCYASTSALAYLPNDASNFDTYLDDSDYTNVATSDNLYDSLTAATSSRLAFNFKRASTTNTDQISVTWEGQISISTTTSLQIYNNTSGAWETLQSSTTPTAGADFTLTGTQTTSLSSYYDASNIVAVRAVTGTTTQTTTIKTDQIAITLTAATSQSLAFSISGNTVHFGTLSSVAARYASSTAAGDSGDTSDAHTLTASTTASGGYVITVNGTTLASGANTIATSSTAVASSPGTEQFGLRLIVNSGTGSTTSPYSTAGWAFDSLNFPDQVASGLSDGSTSVFGVRYIGNIRSDTEAGSYSTTLTFVATATF